MNNKGFTLLEVLVAVVILAVVSVPLLRSFATAAQTNRKSKIEEKCTTAAENLAESFRDVSIEKLKAKYGDADPEFKEEVFDDPSFPMGVRYTFHVEDQDLIGSSMPDGYFADVVLDSRYYENANNLNLSKIEPVSIKDSAIYTMDPTEGLPDTLASFGCNEDAEAYEWFYQRNLAAAAIGSYELIGDTQQVAWDYLRKNLKREIRFDVQNKGSYAPVAEEPTETIDLVTITMTITYNLEGHDGQFFPITDNMYIQKEAVLFDNTSSKDELRAIYLFFYPRYAAGCVAGAERDKIVLNNPSNEKLNFYVTAMDGADNPEKKATYLSMGGLCLDVIENNPDVATNPANVTLRTNLNSGAPYSAADTRTGIGKLQMTLKYKTNQYDVKKSGQDAADFLNAANLDGKVLDKDKTTKRIYKMNVKISDGTTVEVGGEEIPNYIIDFDGTKLEY